MIGRIGDKVLKMNFRTTAPCGMPKGESLVSLEAGSSINVSWHLGYPHRGNMIFLMQYLDSINRSMHSLTMI